ncbi:MAG: AAA family ATPase [Bdellovibrionales bacterium]|nr:AAA family ATPase [Bdellovibrionales bacterium]
MSSLLSKLLPSLHPDLGSDQIRAMELLGGDQNVFITGNAGTGKSYVINKFLSKLDRNLFPVLASTGAAAVLIGGRTFHSFFGLGIMEGGIEATVQRALENKRVVKRLNKARGVVIDEISMIPGAALEAAERIAALARGKSGSWGGLRIVAVGDFAQLPPVTRTGQRDWAFLSHAWQRTEFDSILLQEIMRTKNEEFARALNGAREGRVSSELRNLLDWRTITDEDPDFEGSLLFARRDEADRLNAQKLAALDNKVHAFETRFVGDERFVKSLRSNLPIADTIELKRDALVMIRQNDPEGKWVNGSLGKVQYIDEGQLDIRLLSGKTVTVEKAVFRMNDGEGKELATAANFPVSLAWAVTIHKAQGATLDQVRLNLIRLWEPGQAYVALSRVRDPDDLFIGSWDERSIIADPLVKKFHDQLQEPRL